MNGMNKDTFLTLTSTEAKQQWQYGVCNEDGELALKYYKGNCEDLIIPAYIGKAKVVEIEDWALNPYKYSDTSQRFNFGFYHIRKIEIPATIKKIGARAFGALNVAEIHLPDSISHIAETAFSDCQKLEKILVSEDNKHFKSVDGILYSRDMRSLICCPSAAKITNTPITVDTVRINAYSFYGCNTLTRAELLNVSEIGEKAFSNCKQLRSVAVMNPKTIVDPSAFADCTEIESVIATGETLKGILKSVKKDRRIILCYNYLHSNNSISEYDKQCRTLKEHLLSMILENDAVEAMANFLKCFPDVAPETVQSYIELAVGKTDLTAYLLEYMNSHFTDQELVQYSQERNDAKLGTQEKTLADWRKIFKLAKNNSGYTITGYKGSDPDVYIPDAIAGNPVTEIGKKAFAKQSVVRVVIPESVTQINYEAFKNCDQLAEIILPSGIHELCIESFAGCKSLTAIDIPSGVTKIANEAFKECGTLEHISIPNGTIDIGHSAFRYCGKLERITIPNSVTYIGWGSFYGCAVLTIHAPAGSYAETYAKENNIPFVAE